MIHKIARYRIREEERSRTEEAIATFVQAVRANEPHTRYSAYRLEEGPDYIHLMEFVDQEAERQHQTADYTKAFVAVLYEACVEHPRFADLNAVGPGAQQAT